MNGILDELKRQARTTDMLITMYSVVSSSYHRRALFVDIALLISSALLTVFIFFDYDVLNNFNVNIENAKFFINISSLSTFLLSLIALIVDWKGKSEKHEQACLQLSKLKDEYRVILSVVNSIDSLVLRNQTLKYNQILSFLPRIPSSQFNKLKIIHKRKVLISKLIDAHPGVSLTLLKLKVFLKYNKKLFNEKID